MRARVVMFLLVAVAVAGCQSYRDGIQAICEAPSTCGAPCARATPPERAIVVARHVDAQVSNGRAEDFFDSLGTISPEARAARLRQEATSLGLQACPLADLLAR